MQMSAAKATHSYKYIFFSLRKRKIFKCKIIINEMKWYGILYFEPTCLSMKIFLIIYSFKLTFILVVWCWMLKQWHSYGSLSFLYLKRGEQQNWVHPVWEYKLKVHYPISSIVPSSSLLNCRFFFFFFFFVFSSSFYSLPAAVSVVKAFPPLFFANFRWCIWLWIMCWYCRFWVTGHGILWILFHRFHFPKKNINEITWWPFLKVKSYILVCGA